MMSTGRANGLFPLAIQPAPGRSVKLGIDTYAEADDENSLQQKIFIGVLVGVGVAILIIILAFVIVCIIWRRRVKRKRNNSSQLLSEEQPVPVPQPVKDEPLPPSAAFVPPRVERGSSLKNEGLSQHGSMEVEDGFIIIRDEQERQLAIGEAQRTINNLPRHVRSKVTGLLVAHGRIKVDQTVLRGNFGELAFGTCSMTPNSQQNRKPVFIKTLNRFMHGQVINKFLEDALILEGCEGNVNCLAPLAVAFRRGRPLAIYPYADVVNLKIFITDESNQILTRVLVDLANQLAAAMLFLSESKSIVHKDIAARNCL